MLEFGVHEDVQLYVGPRVLGLVGFKGLRFGGVGSKGFNSSIQVVGLLKSCWFMWGYTGFLIVLDTGYTEVFR